MAIPISSLLLLLLISAAAADGGTGGTSPATAADLYHIELLPPILLSLGYQLMAMAVNSVFPSPIHSSFTGTLTIFVPSDDSVLSCSPPCYPLFLLREHLVPGRLSAADLVRLPFASKIHTAANARCLTLTYTASRSKFFQDGVKIARPDLFNDGNVAIHGLQGFAAPLSPPLPNAFPPSLLDPSTILPVALLDAIVRLHCGGYSVLALALHIKHDGMEALHNLTAFAFDDEVIFAGVKNYVGNVRFHIVPGSVQLYVVPHGLQFPHLPLVDHAAAAVLGEGGIFDGTEACDGSDMCADRPTASSGNQAAAGVPAKVICGIGVGFWIWAILFRRRNCQTPPTTPQPPQLATLERDGAQLPRVSCTAQVHKLPLMPSIKRSRLSISGVEVVKPHMYDHEGIVVHGLERVFALSLHTVRPLQVTTSVMSEAICKLLDFLELRDLDVLLQWVLAHHELLTGLELTIFAAEDASVRSGGMSFVAKGKYSYQKMMSLDVPVMRVVNGGELQLSRAWPFDVHYVSVQ